MVNKDYQYDPNVQDSMQSSMSISTLYSAYTIVNMVVLACLLCFCQRRLLNCTEQLQQTERILYTCKDCLCYCHQQTPVR